MFTEDASSLLLLYYGAKKSKMTKNSNQGGPLKCFKVEYSHFRLVRTQLTRNFGLHAQNPLVQNQIALTHILYRFG